MTWESASMKSKFMTFKDVKELRFLDIPLEQVFDMGKGSRAFIKCNGGMQKIFNIQKARKWAKFNKRTLKWQE